MAIENRRTMTVEEYFQLEENDPETRYEYIGGHVYAMAGGTANHDTIKSNIQRILWNLLRGSKCRVYSSDMKVYISETRYFHPDVIVTCDPRDRGTIQAIQFPRLVVEVLSPNHRTHRQNVETQKLSLPSYDRRICSGRLAIFQNRNLSQRE